MVSVKRDDLEKLAVVFTLLAGIVAVVTYFETKKTKVLQEKNAELEKQIKELQLSKLKGVGKI